MILPSPRSALLCAAIISSPGLAVVPMACAPLTTPERAALSSAEPAILALDAWACSESALIPVVGAAIAAFACPGEESAVRGAIDRAVAGDGGVVATAAPQVVTRAASPGRRVCIGRIGSGGASGKDGGK